MGEVVTLDKLEDEKFGMIICYPKYDPEELKKRVEEMKHLGINSLEFTGEKLIFNVPVLGKGYVGIVILAHTKSGKAALKIRRVDADRSRMRHEAEMLKKANSACVGPRLIGFTDNLLLMEFIDGILIPKWITALSNEEAKLRVRKVLRDLLEQAWRLDESGLDHGELSQASKHIIVTHRDKACILDFETSSIIRRVSNVTSLSQYLFMRSNIAENVKEKIVKIEEDELIKSLREYKRNRSRENFEKILKTCRL